MNDALQHYGVKGMKWGVRRYTNKNGTLNSAGKRRYNDGGDLTPEQQRRRTIAKRVAIGAGVTAAAVLGTYGAYKLANSPQAKKYVSRGQAVVNSSKNSMRASMSQAKMSVDNARIGASIAGNQARRAADAGLDRARQIGSRAQDAAGNARIGASIAGNQARRTYEDLVDRGAQVVSSRSRKGNDIYGGRNYVRMVPRKKRR